MRSNILSKLIFASCVWYSDRAYYGLCVLIKDTIYVKMLPYKMAYFVVSEHPRNVRCYKDVCSWWARLSSWNKSLESSHRRGYTMFWQIAHVKELVGHQCVWPLEQNWFIYSLPELSLTRHIFGWPPQAVSLIAHKRSASSLQRIGSRAQRFCRLAPNDVSSKSSFWWGVELRTLGAQRTSVVAHLTC